MADNSSNFAIFAMHTCWLNQNMENFNSYMDNLDMTVWHEICLQNGMVKHYRKGEVFVWQGDVIKYFGFIRKGYFKYTITDTEGHEHITGFVFSNGLVGDFLSTVNKESVKTNIIAATDVEVIQCPASVLKRQLEHSPALRRAMTEGLFRQAYMRYLDLHGSSPKARYLALLKRCPDILQNITLKEMASYLQITPTHLSRIRKELTFTNNTLE